MQTEDLASDFGIGTWIPGPDGRVPVSDETRLHLLHALGVDPQQAPPTQQLADDERPLHSCYLPDWLRTRRAWGIAVQLYELRSARNWGIGDFADLATFCEVAAQAGASLIGLNPLHALFLADPDRCSPFSPSSRRFLNPLYIAVDAVAGFEPEMVESGEFEKLRQTEFVDYEGVARLKLDVLRKIWSKTGSDALDAVETMMEEDPLVERHGMFEALSLHHSANGSGAGWLEWPEPYRDAASADVAAFARARRDEVRFHVWLQWIARRQLKKAADAAREAGMRIGLYLDFAVGEAPDGSASWSSPDLVVTDVSIGAPPDVFSAKGQDWGLAPLSPLRLADNGFESYRGLMEAAMRDAGALRIDHAMSLRQLFWIPPGRGAANGAFVRYPMNGMLKALSDLSAAQEVVIIGEDLGHVPDGFRETMAETGIFSYRILYFEQSGNGFIPSRSWPSLALACLSTHDLPTLKGWWRGHDIDLRRDHGLIDHAAAAAQHRERRREKDSLLRRMQREALLRSTEARSMSTKKKLDDGDFVTLAIAAHRLIGRTPSRLACMRLADALGEDNPTNLPGTSTEYPNWRRKLAVPLEDIASHPLFAAMATAMQRERPA